MSTVQAAAACGYSADTVARWCKTGKLASHRPPGGHRRIKVADLRAFAERHGIPLDDVEAG